MWMRPGLPQQTQMRIKSSKQGKCELDNGSNLNVRFIEPSEDEYAGYYNTISNPLLWFLQHNMWDGIRTPSITRETWTAWNEGYIKVNEQFADAIAEEVRNSEKPCLVMLQDYHLYLAPQFLRSKLRRKNQKHEVDALHSHPLARTRRLGHIALGYAAGHTGRIVFR